MVTVLGPRHLVRADEQSGVQVESKGGIQRLSEGAPECVQQHHRVRHAVEGERPLLSLQVNANARAGGRRHRGLTVVMPRGVTSVSAAQPPGVLITTQ